MLRYLVRRVMTMAPIVLAAAFIVFAVGRMAPGGPVQILFGDISDPLLEATARAKLGLDQPWPVQYGRFIVGLARFDLGSSYTYPGRTISGPRAPKASPGAS